jgi:hypothetical protein
MGARWGKMSSIEKPGWAGEIIRAVKMVWDVLVCGVLDCLGDFVGRGLDGQAEKII